MVKKLFGFYVPKVNQNNAVLLFIDWNQLKYTPPRPINSCWGAVIEDHSAASASETTI